MAVPEKLLSVPEIAEALAVTQESVRRWLRDGELKGIRLASKAGWRVREADLQAFLEQHMPQGTGGRDDAR